MNSSEQKSLELSLHIYRRLLRVYPAHFLNQFGDQLAQTFGDLARRALGAGGRLHLLLLWMRILPDLGLSAIREHFNVSAWTSPAHLRLRWVAACTLGCGFGSLAGVWVSGPGGGSNGLVIVNAALFMLVLGIFQSAWGLKRPAGDVVRWTLATMVGTFLIALPVRVAVFGWPVYSIDPASEMGLTLLRGLGIGICQFLIFPKSFPKAWHWIPANAFGVVLTALGTLMFVRLVGPSQLELLPFLTGAIFGCITAIPLGGILRPKNPIGVEGAVQS